LQVPIAHVPLLQVGVASVVTQMFPHLPQLATLLAVLTSHPSLGLLSQSAKPALHVMLHTPLVQAGWEFGPEAHMLPHDPQLRTVVMFVSHPFIALLSQFAVPGSQAAMPHTPLTQLGIALAAEHWFPQLPHEAGSLEVCVSHPFAGFMSQSLQPAEQVIPHLPSLQTGFDSGP
jgi:hypothetical protein